MAEDKERSAIARERAERALVWILHDLRDTGVELLIVLGGLVPPTLASRASGDVPPHLGTADVDILLITQLADVESLRSVEVTLIKLQFDPVDGDGWRWRGEVDGKGVIIEFLCDLDDYKEGEYVQPPSCDRLTALNLRGTGYVAKDVEPRQISAELSTGEKVEVTASYAGLRGYLLSKCVAVRVRSAEKDHYDLVYVLLHNEAGGPMGAADAIRESALKDAVRPLRSTFIEVRERFRRTADFGPSSFASQMRLVDPSLDDAPLRADAVVAVQEFVEVLLS